MQKYQIHQLPSTPSSYYSSQKLPHNNLNQSNQSSISNNYDQFSIQQYYQQRNNKNNTNNKKYGNIKILFENDNFLFTIGPDYGCFITGFLFFILMHVGLNMMVMKIMDNMFVIISSLLVCILQSFSYLFVSLSNPGVQTKDTIPTEEDNPTQQIKRFCKKCAIRMQQRTFHCRICDVCIRQWDHHCPWTSKCIGQKNLTKFYVFVIGTFFYLIYFVIVIITCLAKQTSKNGGKMFLL